MSTLDEQRNKIVVSLNDQATAERARVMTLALKAKQQLAQTRPPVVQIGSNNSGIQTVNPDTREESIKRINSIKNQNLSNISNSHQAAFNQLNESVHQAQNNPQDENIRPEDTIEIANSEYVLINDFNNLTEEDQKLLKAVGIDKFNAQKDKEQKEFENNHVKLNNGDYVLKKDYNDLSNEDQNRLTKLGVDGFNQYQIDNPQYVTTTTTVHENKEETKNVPTTYTVEEVSPLMQRTGGHLIDEDAGLQTFNEAKDKGDIPSNATYVGYNERTGAIQYNIPPLIMPVGFIGPLAPGEYKQGSLTIDQSPVAQDREINRAIGLQTQKGINDAINEINIKMTAKVPAFGGAAPASADLGTVADAMVAAGFLSPKNAFLANFSTAHGSAVPKWWFDLTDEQKRQVAQYYNEDKYKTSIFAEEIYGMNIGASKSGIAAQLATAPVSAMATPIAKARTNQIVTKSEIAMGALTAIALPIGAAELSGIKVIGAIGTGIKGVGVASGVGLEGVGIQQYVTNYSNLTKDEKIAYGSLLALPIVLTAKPVGKWQFPFEGISVNKYALRDAIKTNITELGSLDKPPKTYLSKETKMVKVPSPFVESVGNEGGFKTLTFVKPIDVTTNKIVISADIKAPVEVIKVTGSEEFINAVKSNIIAFGKKVNPEAIKTNIERAYINASVKYSPDVLFDAAKNLLTVKDFKVRIPITEISSPPLINALASSPSKIADFTRRTGLSLEPVIKDIRTEAKEFVNDPTGVIGNKIESGFDYINTIPSRLWISTQKSFLNSKLANMYVKDITITKGDKVLYSRTPMIDNLNANNGKLKPSTLKKYLIDNKYVDPSILNESEPKVGFRWIKRSGESYDKPVLSLKLTEVKPDSASINEFNKALKDAGIDVKIKNEPIWKGLTINDRPIIGKTQNGYVFGSKQIETPEMSNLPSGYKPITQVETNVMTDTTKMKLSGMLEEDIAKLQPTMKGMKSFGEKTSPYAPTTITAEEIKSLNKGSVATVLQKLSEADAVDETYGSMTIKVQLDPALRNWRTPGDIDVQLKANKEESIIWAKDLATRLEETEGKGNVKVDEGTSLIETKDKATGEWHHAVDVHSIDDQAGSPSIDQAAGYGYVENLGQPSLVVEYPGQGELKIMNLSESGVRKGIAILRWWNKEDFINTAKKQGLSEETDNMLKQLGVENKDKFIAPEPKRMKDIADFYVILHTYEGEEVANTWAKTYGFDPSELLKTAKENPPTTEFSIQYSPKVNTLGKTPSMRVYVPISEGDSKTSYKLTTVPVEPYNRSASIAQTKEISPKTISTGSTSVGKLTENPYGSLSTSDSKILGESVSKAIGSPSKIIPSPNAIIPSPSEGLDFSKSISKSMSTTIEESKSISSSSGKSTNISSKSIVPSRSQSDVINSPSLGSKPLSPSTSPELSPEPSPSPSPSTSIPGYSFTPSPKIPRQNKSISKLIPVDSSSKNESKYPDGTYVWKQGEVKDHNGNMIPYYRILPPPWKQADLTGSTIKPPGTIPVQQGKGSSYRSIEVVGGIVPGDVNVKLGIEDISIHSGYNGKPVIKFTRNEEANKPKVQPKQIVQTTWDKMDEGGHAIGSNNTNNKTTNGTRRANRDVWREKRDSYARANNFVWTRSR